MSQLRKLRKQEQKHHNLKIKRQKTVFSSGFILTLIISFIMLVICAINNAPTLITTTVSGCAWLIFDLLFAYAMKNKCHQAPLSMGFSRQEYWNGLPFPSPGDLPNPGIEPGFPALQTDSLLSKPPGKPLVSSRLHLLFVDFLMMAILTSFPGGLDSKASACNVGDLGSIPGSGRSPGEGNGNPFQYSCLGNSMD